LICVKSRSALFDDIGDSSASMFWLRAYLLDFGDMATIVQAILFSGLWVISLNMQRNKI
jgi:hypothetical protein